MTLSVCKGGQVKKHERMVRAIKKSKHLKPRRKGQSKKSAAIAIANVQMQCFVKRR